MSEIIKSLPGDWTDPLEKIMTLQSQLATLKLENENLVELFDKYTELMAHRVECFSRGKCTCGLTALCAEIERVKQ